MKKNLRPLIIVLCLLAAPLGLSAQSLVFHLTGGGKTIVDLPAEFTLTPDGNQLTIAIGGGQNVTLSKGDVMCVTYRESRGDVNGDQRVSVADVATLVGMLLGSSSSSGNAPANLEAVDLGLPSGTLWASMNIGASSPEDYGDYFAWGETTGYKDGKTSFLWSNYKWSEGSNTSMTKYCNKSDDGNNGFTDNKTQLDPEDDAAYANWGADWRMPTIEQCNELCTKCTWTWKTENNVNGYEVTGPNGNSIFLPAPGCYEYGSSIWGADTNGLYWSRTLNTQSPSGALYLNFSNTSFDANHYNARCNGLPVRPVRNSQ